MQKRKHTPQLRHNSSMDIQLYTQYYAQLNRVAAVLTSRELTEKRASALGLEDYSWSIACPHEDTIRTITRLNIPSKALPSQIQKFTSTHLEAIVTSTTSKPNEYGSITIMHDVKIANIPVNTKVTIVLTHAANIDKVTQAEITVCFSISIPFIGNRLEKEAATYIEQALREDTRLVNSLLEREQ